MTKTTLVNVRDFIVDRRVEFPDDVVYIGRRANRYRLPASPFANPYRIGALWKVNGGYLRMNRDDVLWCFSNYFDRLLREDPEWLEPLRGKRLACWCPPKECHGDVYVEWLAQHPPLPKAGEPIIFGYHAQRPGDAETAPAWPSLNTVRARADAAYKRELRKVRP